jgi:hypothetical protein
MIDPTVGQTVARLAFPTSPDPVFLILDRELARDHLVARVLARAAARAHDTAALTDGLRQLAESLGWRVCTEAGAGAEIITVARA